MLSYFEKGLIRERFNKNIEISECMSTVLHSWNKLDLSYMDQIELAELVLKDIINEFVVREICYKLRERYVSLN